jgi:hypothetical protein
MCWLTKFVRLSTVRGAVTVTPEAWDDADVPSAPLVRLEKTVPILLATIIISSSIRTWKVPVAGNGHLASSSLIAKEVSSAAMEPSRMAIGLFARSSVITAD